MQRLSTKYGVAYTISHCARQQWRWNSTAAASASFTQPNKRLATNYGDVSIPAQGEAATPEPWTPDAQSVEAHSAGRTITPEERRQRILEAELQRRQERIATQERVQQRQRRSGPQGSPGKPKIEEHSVERKLRIRAAEEQRRNERLTAAQAAMDFAMDAPAPRRPARSQNQNSQRPTTRSQTRAKAAATKEARKPKAAVAPSEPQGLVEEEADGADITMEEVENGGDAKPPAEFQTAEFNSSDLDGLFRSTSLPHYPLTTQAIREKLGGNYFRYSPLDTPADRSGLSPSQQVNFIFAKRRDVPINLRQDAAAIVASSTGSLETKVAQSS